MNAQPLSITIKSDRPRRCLRSRKMITLTILLTLMAMLWTVGAAGAISPPPQDGEIVYTVQAADWLSKLADKYYGDSGAWPAIWLATNARAAEDDTFEVILDPDLLEIGQTLLIPDAEEASMLVAGFAEEQAATFAAAPKTLRLPDLDGRTVVAVTENAYTPLNFVDPLTGEAVGWEYEATEEICRRLNCVVDW